MKKKFLLIPVLALLACTENRESEAPLQEEQFCEVTFTPSWETMPMGDTKADLEGNVTKLEYIALHEGEKRQHLVQDATTEGFSEFKPIVEKLPFGENRIFLVAHNSDALSDNNGQALFTKVTDTFMKEVVLDIADKTAKTQTVTLERAVGRLEIVSTDALPDNVGSITVRLDRYRDRLQLYGGDVQTVLFEKNFVYGAAQRNGKGIKHTIYSFIGGEKQPMSISIIIRGLKEEILWQRNLGNVDMLLNRTVRFTGMLYGPDSSSTGFTFQIDNEWGDDVDFEL